MTMIKTTLLSAVIGITATSALALPVQWGASDGGNGHWYEYVLDWGSTWQDASANAASSTHQGMTGHLVTITSAAENAFVRALATSQNPWGNVTDILIGATDFESEWGSDATSEWVWTGGPETGKALSEGYTNWANGEPDFWAISAMMNSSGAWFGSDGYAAPYVIEYSFAESPVAAPPSVPLPGSGVLLLAAFGGGALLMRRRANSARK